MESTLDDGTASRLPFVLREDGNWVELRPRGARLAEVTGGSLYAPGDLVERPRSVSWEQALLPATGTDTALSPFALTAVYDSLRHEYLFQQYGSPGPPSLLAEAPRTDDAAYSRYLTYLLSPDDLPLTLAASRPA